VGDNLAKQVGEQTGMFYLCTHEDPEPKFVFDHRLSSGDSKGPTIALDTLQSLITAQEAELSNIARELHDDICQRLALLSLKIEKVAKCWAAGQVQIGEQLQQIWDQCSVLTGDVQALSRELHPSILDNLGLVAAVTSICREITAQSGMIAKFTSRNVPSYLPREVSLSLFRVIQEALHNSAKHSCGGQCHVCLHGEPGWIALEVNDQGVGFDVVSATNKGGLGLIGMRERIQLLTGSIRIDSHPNAGTRICARVPIATEEGSSTLPFIAQ